tara:strand:+ start:150 stop:710 length:561 start_codon:yes stop_codon:yes gene_type:complete
MANGTLKVENIQTSSGSGTITLGQSGETIAFGSGVTSKMNQPAFEAYLGSDQSVSNNTVTKVQINTEVFDTDSCYDNSTNYRFTPTVAGKYYVYGSIASYTGQIGDNLWIGTNIYKNGSVYRETRFNMNNNYGEWLPGYIYAIIDMNGSTDYLELWGLSYAADGAGNVFQANTKATFFGAYRIGVE